MIFCRQTPAPRCHVGCTDASQDSAGRQGAGCRGHGARHAGWRCIVAAIQGRARCTATEEKSAKAVMAVGGGVALVKSSYTKYKEKKS